MHLVSTAPVINQAAVIAEVTTDIDGQARGTNPDVGADEYVLMEGGPPLPAPIGDGTLDPVPLVFVSEEADRRVLRENVDDEGEQGAPRSDELTGAMKWLADAEGRALIDLLAQSIGRDATDSHVDAITRRAQFRRMRLTSAAADPPRLI
jgi:hypothetical protein